MFAIDDETTENTSPGVTSRDSEVESVNLNLWLEKPDVLNKFKCFYREKNEKKTEWVPGYDELFLISWLRLN